MKAKPQYELAGAEEVFNLRSETTADGEELQRKRRQEKEEAERAAAIVSKQQLCLL